jgi:hypothetical protein
LSGVHRNAELRVGERGADVRGHVVGAFGGVPPPRYTLNL